MIDRLRVALVKVEAINSATSRSDYLQVAEDLLAPRNLAVEFAANLYQRETVEREELSLGGVRGKLAIEDGVPSIYVLEIESDLDGSKVPITSRLLERIPLQELALMVTSRCCLTPRQDAHYEIVPVPEEPFERVMDLVTNLQFPVRQLAARAKDEPIPVRHLPKPVLVDENGLPWYRVQVSTEPVRALSRQKRPRITQEFLLDVWRVYSAASAAGRPTTEAVQELGLRRTGRIPPRSTTARWIKQAKELHGEGSNHAKD